MCLITFKVQIVIGLLSVHICPGVDKNMCEILYANEKSSDYENFYATCPYCEQENIFNRRSDLGTLEPVTFKQVKCLNPDCEKVFNINGYLANAAFEMLIYDCYELFRKKRYSYCILNLAQACEVFLVCMSMLHWHTNHLIGKKIARKS